MKKTLIFLLFLPSILWGQNMAIKLGSDTITYSGSLATTANINDSLANMKSGIFNVLDYGADNTGVSDNRMIIQSLIASKRIVVTDQGSTKTLKIKNITIRNLNSLGQ